MQATKLLSGSTFLTRLRTVNGATAAGVWLFGAWLSARAGAQASGYDITGWQSPPLQLVAVAMFVQWLLTRGQSPFWRWHLHRRAVPPQVFGIALFSLLIDMLINAGGVWPLAQNLGKVDAWKIIEAASQPGDPNVMAKIGMALFVGVVIAGFAEYFWNLED